MKGGVNLGYQSEAELEERLMTKLESQGYERIKIEDYEALVENFRAGDYVILKSKRGTEESPVYYYGILQVMQLFDDSGSMAVKEDTGKQYIDRQKGHDLFYKPNYFSVKTQCEILK